MRTPLTLSTLALAVILGLQTGCAQALSPAEPDHAATAANYAYAPSRETQTLQSVGNTVRISIKDRASASKLPVYYSKGEYWVVGRPDQAYSINFQSAFGRRVLATTSVDGINIITGEAAGYVQRGYILSPNATYDVTGWRKSEHEVAAFNFARPGASYAAQTGRPANVGVIGVAVFPELYTPPPPPIAPPMAQPLGMPAPASTGKMKSEASNEMAEDANIADGAIKEKKVAQSAPTAAAPVVPSPGLGTQHGAREASYSPTTAFRRESNSPAEIIQLRYDTAENLVARGVLQWMHPAQRPYSQPPRPRPQSFPQSGGYVADPK